MGDLQALMSAARRGFQGPAGDDCAFPRRGNAKRGFQGPAGDDFAARRGFQGPAGDDCAFPRHLRRTGGSHRRATAGAPEIARCHQFIQGLSHRQTTVAARRAGRWGSTRRR